MIEKIFITSFMVFAIWYTMQEGEIFERLGRWFGKYLPDKMQKPVYECPVCMAPWYGTIIYWVIFNGSVKEWVIVVIAAMGLNAIFNKMFPPDEIELKDEEH